MEDEDIPKKEKKGLFYPGDRERGYWKTGPVNRHTQTLKRKRRENFEEEEEGKYGKH
ncbi:hypothetical protein PROFUN_17025 [Planoprotostelium fungivorum]|uniref:Uncharacterized protein n=1 Tax=Planoprotostelium fungivorum TaxID=1890364 RepID=A0A2P6MML3_9EUKA|nr:hypothetical protein PROFUN_17025 [Planoprotostelium fungivorum]